ncbi:MAG: hypothetical protein O2967_21485 [Proteobacteria bacterium]|nr:hypothetical protein [Pseudomonadota bacterium]
MKKIILGILALIVVLGGAGGGLYGMGMLDEFLGLDQKNAAEGVENSGAASGQGTDAEQSNQAHFVLFEPISAPIIAAGRVQYQVIVTLSLQVAGIAKKNDVQAVLPRLRDAMHTEFFTNPISVNEVNGTIDLPDLKKRVLLLTRGMVGDKGIEDVLVLNILRMGG